MRITFFLVTLCACATSYNHPCACAIKGTSFVHRVFCLVSLSLLSRLNSWSVFFMAACDKCSFDYFQVIAEFYNNDAKSLSFLRSRRSKGKSCIYYYFLFYSVLFLVFPVHLHLDLIVLWSESRLILGGGGGVEGGDIDFFIINFF